MGLTELRMPLLPAQEGLWFVEQLYAGPSAHNVFLALDLNGTLDLSALSRALEALVTRHAALRVTIAEDAGTPVQVVAARTSVGLSEVDLRSDPDSLLKQMSREQAGPFRFDVGPLFRVTLYKLADTAHVLLLVVHHLVSDGTSVDVLARDLCALYDLAVQGQPVELPFAVDYLDHVRRERDMAHGPRAGRALAYWKSELSGTPPAVRLPMARTPAVPRSRRATTYGHDLPLGLVTELRALARTRSVSMFAAMSATVFALVARYTGETDFSLGVPLSSRLDPGTENLVGLLVHTMPVRVQVTNSTGFGDLVDQVGAKVFNALRHRQVSFNQVVREINPGRHAGRHPVFQMVVNHWEVGDSAAAHSGLEVVRRLLGNPTAAFDLMMSFVEHPDRVTIYFEYESDVFEPDTVRRIAGHLVQLSRSAVERPFRPIRALRMMDEAERSQILYEWNDTGAPVPDGALPELFRQQVERTADAPAVTAGKLTLSYAELNAHANRLAHRLVKLGAGPDRPVAVLLERSANLVVSILAVMKTGSAYVPLHGGDPDSRAELIIAESRAVVVLTDRHRQLGPGVHVIVVDSLALDEPEHDPGIVPAEGQPAYIMYTSGSTGSPKDIPGA
jgi:hypothetical protein